MWGLGPGDSLCDSCSLACRQVSLQRLSKSENENENENEYENENQENQENVHTVHT